MIKPFIFKQFQVYDHLSTMKVGTDAVLLGAWSEPPLLGEILDAGTGCGVIALMMAQKSYGRITAIDVHAGSVGQAASNFVHSPWNNRLKALESSIEALTEIRQGFFDFVISNPPFFFNSLKPSKPDLLIAKHAESGFIDIFLRSVSILLKPGGKAAWIIPYDISEKVLKKCATHGMYPQKIATVSGNPGSSPVRVMLEMSKVREVKTITEKISIYNENQRYSEAYKTLTQDFYLFLNE